jgi:hypothetical protein
VRVRVRACAVGDISRTLTLRNRGIDVNHILDKCSPGNAGRIQSKFVKEERIGKKGDKNKDIENEDGKKKEKKCVRDRNFEREKNFFRFSYEENKFFSRVLVTASSITLFSFLSRFLFFSFCNSFFFLSPEVFFLLLCRRMVQNVRYVLLMSPYNRRYLMSRYTLSISI